MKIINVLVWIKRMVPNDAWVLKTVFIFIFYNNKFQQTPISMMYQISMFCSL